MTSQKRLFADEDEEGRVTPRKRTIDTELDITPMIDVTFLLLIFFLVSSTMDPAKQLDLPAAEFGVGVKSDEAATITVKQGFGAQAPVVLLDDGQEVDMDGVRDYVQQQLAKNYRRVIIQAEREVPHGLVQQVTRVVASVEGVEFFLAVEEKRR